MIPEPPGPTDLYEIIDWHSPMTWREVFLGVMMGLIGHVLAWFYYTFLDRGEEERTIRNLQG